MLLPRLWRPLSLRYSARAASELCASALAGPPVLVGLCSYRRAFDSARWSSQEFGTAKQDTGAPVRTWKVWVSVRPETANPRSCAME